MKVGENIIELFEGDEIPEGARLITIEKVFSHWEQEDEEHLHFLQTPATWKVYKNCYIYEVKK